MKKIIILLIFGILFIIFNSEDSQAVACCEKIRGSSEYCVDGDSVASCDTSSGFKSYQGQNCDRVPSCQTGTCIFDRGGSCFNDQFRISCEKNEGSWDPRDSSEVPIFLV